MLHRLAKFQNKFLVFVKKNQFSSRTLLQFHGHKSLSETFRPATSVENETKHFQLISEVSNNTVHLLFLRKS